MEGQKELIAKRNALIDERAKIRLRIKKAITIEEQDRLWDTLRDLNRHIDSFNKQLGRLTNPAMGRT